MAAVYLFVDQLCVVRRIGREGRRKDARRLQSLPRFDSPQEIHLRQNLAHVRSF